MQRWRAIALTSCCSAQALYVEVAAEAAAVMPDSGRASISPLVASGTDSRSSKVRGPKA